VIVQLSLKALFDVILAPFRFLPDAAGLIWLSALAGVLLALLFRATSDQEAIGSLRRRMNGLATGLLLHVSSPSAVVGTAGRLLAMNARYLLAIAPALLAASVVFTVFLGQAEARFGSRAPAAGDTVLVVFSGYHGPAEDTMRAGGAASLVPPLFRSEDGRTIAARLAFHSNGPAIASLGGDSLRIGADRRSGVVGRSFTGHLSLDRLVRPDLRLEPGAHSASAVAALRTQRYRLLPSGVSVLAVLVAVSTLSAIVLGALLRIRI
jgi:hypothetical protein